MSEAERMGREEEQRLLQIVSRFGQSIVSVVSKLESTAAAKSCPSTNGTYCSDHSQELPWPTAPAQNSRHAVLCVTEMSN